MATLHEAVEISYCTLHLLALTTTMISLGIIVFASQMWIPGTGKFSLSLSHTHTHTHTHTRMHACTCAHTHTLMHEHVHEWTHTCTHARAHTQAHTHTHTHTHREVHNSSQQSTISKSLNFHYTEKYRPFALWQQATLLWTQRRVLWNQFRFTAKTKIQNLAKPFQIYSLNKNTIKR